MIYRNRQFLDAVAALPCQLRIDGICTGGPSVACHSNQLIDGKGRGIKASDARVCAGCAACHSWLDQGQATREFKAERFGQAAWRTYALMIESGELVMPNAKPERERPYKRPSKVLARRPG